jgi:hypothetical protein
MSSINDRLVEVSVTKTVDSRVSRQRVIDGVFLNVMQTHAVNSGANSDLSHA